MKSKTSLWCIKYKGRKMWTILPSSGVRFCIPTFPHPSPPISSNSGKEKKCLAFLELAQVKQIMDLSLFITFVMQKPNSPALLLLKTEQPLFYFLWAKQLWWILNPLMTGKAKTNVAIFIWGRGFGVLMKKWHCKLLKMFCPVFNTVNIV